MFFASANSNSTPSRGQPQLYANKSSFDCKKTKCRRLPQWILGMSFLAVMTLQVFLLRNVTTNKEVDNSSFDSSRNGPKQRLIRVERPKPKPRSRPKPKSKPEQSRHTKLEQEPHSKVIITAADDLDDDDDKSLDLIYKTPPRLSDFPKWIQTYVTWHEQMRRDFPGMELFTNPLAPNVLVRTCLGLCGGLHDRLGQLPWDLYLANATGRVLLLAWQRPRKLQNFLVPSPLLDWTVPPEANFGFDDIRTVRNHTRLFEGFQEDRPTQEFWEQDLDAALERANAGAYQNDKILRHKILGHLGEDILEQRLAQQGHTDAIHTAPLFGNIFWLFFQPSLGVDREARHVWHSLQLTPHQYSAVHCRVRHPKAHAYGQSVKGKNPRHVADKTGLPWEGATRQSALDVAVKALTCAMQAAPKDPIYFLSDSNDLVRHVTIELQDEKFINANQTQIDHTLQKVVVESGTIIRARDVTEETAHLDRQKGRPAEAYYSTFIDLLIAIHANCVVYGIGYYAVFAAKISGTPCTYLYQEEAWEPQSKKRAHMCPSTITTNILDTADTLLSKEASPQ
jgi:hypothetical protein